MTTSAYYLPVGLHLLPSVAGWSLSGSLMRILLELSPQNTLPAGQDVGRRFYAGLNLQNFKSAREITQWMVQVFATVQDRGLVWVLRTYVNARWVWWHIGYSRFQMLTGSKILWASLLDTWAWIGKFWLPMSSSVNKVRERDWGRLQVSASGLCTHTHTEAKISALTSTLQILKREKVLKFVSLGANLSWNSLNITIILNNCAYYFCLLTNPV